MLAIVLMLPRFSMTTLAVFNIFRIYKDKLACHGGPTPVFPRLVTAQALKRLGEDIQLKHL